jgi:hypothetical protein
MAFLKKILAPVSMRNFKKYLHSKKKIPKNLLGANKVLLPPKNS